MAGNEEDDDDDEQGGVEDDVDKIIGKKKVGSLVALRMRSRKGARIVGLLECDKWLRRLEDRGAGPGPGNGGGKIEEGESRRED